jgi:hypothetical protein
MIAEAPEASAILKLTATRVLYHMDRAEADQVADYLQLPDWCRAALADGAGRCAPGSAVWQVGNRIHLVRHIRSRAEISLTNTNRRMTEVSTTAGSKGNVEMPVIALHKGGT